MPAHLDPQDFAKHPALAKKLGLDAYNRQDAYSADDKVIPEQLWERPDAALPVVIIHQGSDTVWKMALSIAVAIPLTAIAIIVSVIAGMAAGAALGMAAGALIVYGLTRRNAPSKEGRE